MSSTKPHEDNEEVGQDSDESGRAMTLSLVGTLPVLVGWPSWPTKVSTGYSVGVEFISKGIESRDPSRGVAILKEHFWYCLKGCFLEDE